MDKKENEIQDSQMKAIIAEDVMVKYSVPASFAAYVQNKPYTVDSIGMSGSTVLTFENYVLKIEPISTWALRTVEILSWLEGKLPAPEVICHEVADGKSYLLMSRIQGKMSCDTYYLEHPEELLHLLAKGLRMFWNVDVRNCPHIRNLDAELAEARERVEQGQVDVENAEPGTFGPDGFAGPEELLIWLEENRPEQEPVFSHGDYCLPNVFLQDGEIASFIDLGDAGVGDKWRDIALCYRSLKHNFDGTYGGKVYEDFDPDMLFEALEMEPDWEKLRYYILLDELF
jgi:kanamycin kinase/aminoglycoside 3'-phosphotransferase-3